MFAMRKVFSLPGLLPVASAHLPTATSMCYHADMNNPMDNVRAATINALIEDMSLEDLWYCSEHADTTEDFDAAVNLLTYTMPDDGLLNEVVVSVIFPE